MMVRMTLLGRDVNFLCKGILTKICPVWRFEDEKFFSVGMRMEEKVPPREVWEWGRSFILYPTETPSHRTLLKNSEISTCQQ
jgi:hypothetical protein